MRVDSVRATWERIGHIDPFWGVLSWEGKEGGRWDVEEFFDTGEREVEQFLEEARVVGAEPELGGALDFGCGVGRLSRALARRFQSVDGVDISAPMVEQAERLVGTEFPNCVFTASDRPGLPFLDDRFDFVLSNIVLQHMPGRHAISYVSEFLRVLRPGGIAIFQIPSEQVSGSASTNPVIRAVMNSLPSQWREEIHRRRGRRGERDLPMYGIPREKVIRAVERMGGHLLACIKDQAAGPRWRSYHYIVQTAD
jgi:SAM-dependent methyltransferase